MAEHGNSKFNEENLRLLKFMAENGYTDVQMAQAVGVTEKTFNNWKHRHPDFFQSLKDWKEKADESVERSLYQRALGYSCPETKVMLDKKGKVIEHTFIKHYAPDVTACIFWLKNRKSAEWRDKQDIELDTTQPISITYSKKEA